MNQILIYILSLITQIESGMYQLNKTIIIIPTYNEAQNIKKIIKKIDSLNILNDFLIIDDNSPDKTYDIVKKMMDQRL